MGTVLTRPASAMLTFLVFTWASCSHALRLTGAPIVAKMAAPQNFEMEGVREKNLPTVMAAQQTIEIEGVREKNLPTVIDEAGTKGWDWAAPRLALLAMAGACGTNFPLISIVEETMAPSEATFLRFTVAALPFLPLLAQRLAALNWNFRADETMVPGLEIGAALYRALPSLNVFRYKLLVVVVRTSGCSRLMTDSMPQRKPLSLIMSLLQMRRVGILA